MNCPSCGGVLGRDCFNPADCAWISQRQEAEYHAEQQERLELPTKS